MWQSDPKTAEAGWWNDSWSYRKALTINHNQVAGDLNNFPVLVSLTDAGLSDHAQEDGDDIVFTLNNGTILSHEIESYASSTGALVAWVNIPFLSATADIDIFMYYGNEGVGSQEDVANVWDENYKGVWHMNNESTASSTDSTVNNNDGTMQGTITATSSGKIDGGLEFSVGADRIDIDENTVLDNMQTKTIEAWLKVGDQDGSGVIIGKIDSSDDDPGWRLRMRTDEQIAYRHRFSGGFSWWEYDTSLTIGDWYHVVVTYDISSTSPYIYINGARVAINEVVGKIGDSNDDSSEIVRIGNSSDTFSDFEGVMGELRLSNNIRSASWIQTEYNNQNNPSAFFAVQAEEVGPGPVGYWSFDEGYGTTAHDESGQGNDGAITGAVWKDESECVSGKCLYFDGSGDEVNCGSAGSLDNLKNDFTVSLWIKIPTMPIVRKYLVHKDSAGIGFEVGLYGENLEPTKAGIVDYRNDFQFKENKWYFITTVFSSTDGTVVYVDGIERGSQANTSDVNSHDNYSLKFSDASSMQFEGYMDEVKIYPYVRTADQIKQDYNAGLAGVSSKKGVSASFGGTSDKWMSDGLVGYWKMDETVTTSGAIDSSGNGNSGVYMGNASTTGGRYGYGYVGDGTGDYVDLPNGDTYLEETAGTIVMWYKSNGDDTPILYEYNAGGCDNITIRYVSAVSLQFFYAVDCKNAGAFSIPVDNISTNFNWHFVVYTWDKQTNTRAYFYDGNYGENKAIISDGTFSAANSAIGANGSGVASFNGNIDEVRIYNRALSKSEVQRLYEWAPGPVIHWRMDEKQGDKIYDLTGNGNTGLLTNMSLSTAWISGKYGSGLDFDGDDDFVDLSSDGSTSYKSGMSVSAWVKLKTSDSATASGRIITTGSAGGFASWFLSWNVSGTFAFSMRNENSVTAQADSDVAYTDVGVWHYVSGVYNGAKVLLYIDGVLQSDQPALTGLTYTDDVRRRIGASSSGVVNINAQIDDVIIYNYARTQKQILEDMNAGGPAVKSPVLHLSFDEGRGETVHDSSIYGNDGTAFVGTGGSQTATSSMWEKEGRVGGAMEFDGTDDYVEIDDNINPVNGITISVWANPPNPPGTTDYFLGKRGNGGGENVGFKFGCAGSSPYDRLIFTIQGVVDQSCDSNNEYIVTTGWHQYVVTYDRNYIIFYKDSEIISKHAQTAAISSASSNLVVGATNTDGSITSHLDGKIDEVKIWNYALNEDEIKQEYNSGATFVMGRADSANDNGTTVTGASTEYCVPGDTSECSPPVLELAFDEKEGSTAYDTSGNGNNGTINGATWFSPGYKGSSLSFDGVDDWVRVEDFDSSNSMTWSFWLKPNSLDGSMDLFSKTDWATQKEWRINLDVDEIELQISSSGAGDEEQLTTDLNLEVDKWTYVAVRYDNGAFDVYKNGILKNDDGDFTTQVSIYNGSRYIEIGEGLMNDYDGIIDDVKIYNYARTPAQIAWDYNRGKPIAEYRFDECSGTVVHNYAGTSLHGTLNLGATGVTATGTCASSSNSFWYNGRTGKKNGGGSFDGTDDYIDIGDIGLDINSVSFWLKQDYTVANIIDLDDGTHTITIADSMVTATGFSSPTIYVDGVSKSTVPDNAWHNVLITTATAIDANNFDIGRIGADYFTGRIDEVKLYNYALTSEQAKTDFSGGAVGFGYSGIQSGSALVSSWTCGDTILNSNDSITYSTVLANDGNCWLASNLGTANIATAFNDSSAYGAYYQWGRLTDGHQISTSGTTGTNSSGDVPGHSDFITESSAPYDWRVPQNDNLWQGVDGTNNPCPTGWRIPTQTEWAAVVSAEVITNYNTAFSSNLKLTAAGVRSRADGSLLFQGSYGYFWSSSPDGSNAYNLFFHSSGADPANSFNRALGFSARCLKN